MSSKPQVEITGLEARFYDLLLNLISFRRYEVFIRRVIADLNLNENEIVMDLGAGTGKNDKLMFDYLGPESRIYALEIGEEMRRQLAELQKNEPRLVIINQRIEKAFRLPEQASLAFISFVIHGLKQENRLMVVQNVADNLRPGGRFCILDYNHFSVDNAAWYIRFGIRRMECKPTEDFIDRDWPALLEEKGFTDVSTKTYFGGIVRLLCSVKK